MGDFSKAQRSFVMSRIRKTNTKPELLVRKFLFAKGFRYRIHYKKLIGSPDIVLVKDEIAIFINGCFWHAHKKCKLNRLPQTNKEYWIPKIKGNANRDLLNKNELQKLGWKVITIWECELKKNKLPKTLNKLISNLIKIKNGQR